MAGDTTVAVGMEAAADENMAGDTTVELDVAAAKDVVGDKQWIRVWQK